MKRIFAATLAAAVVTMPARAAAPPVKIDAIHMQLYYQTSGVLSDDMTTNPDGWWNTIIAEGNAKEPADDILVSVVLTSADDEANLDKPVTVTVRGDKNKVLAKRTFPAVFIKNHRVALPLMVMNAGCAGAVMVEAIYAGQKKTADVKMACGE